jgi:hypothetical protein
MQLLSNHKVTKSFLVDKRTDVVLQEVIKLTNKQATSEGVIELKLKPTFLDPFSGRGTIRIQFTQVHNNDNTTIKCEILPTSIPKEAVITIGVLLFIWTILALVISFSAYSILTIVFGWTLMSLVVYLARTLNQGKLENYVTMIVKNIK